MRCGLLISPGSHGYEGAAAGDSGELNTFGNGGSGYQLRSGNWSPALMDISLSGEFCLGMFCFGLGMSRIEMEISWFFIGLCIIDNSALRGE